MDDIMLAGAVGQRLKILGLNLLMVAIDMAFLSGWLILQWALDTYVIHNFVMHQLDFWMLQIFQAIFAVSTLIPVVCYIYVDSIQIIRRSRNIVGQGSVRIQKRRKETENDYA